MKTYKNIQLIKSDIVEKLSKEDFSKEELLRIEKFIHTLKDVTPEDVTPEEKETLQKGKDFWGGMEVLQKFKGGHITTATMKYLIDAVIENTWMNAKNFFKIGK